MGRQNKFHEVVCGMVSVLDCPLTVKMRTGVYQKNWNAHLLAPKLRDCGVSMVTVRGKARIFRMWYMHVPSHVVHACSIPCQIKIHRTHNMCLNSFLHTKLITFLNTITHTHAHTHTHIHTHPYSHSHTHSHTHAPHISTHTTHITHTYTHIHTHSHTSHITHTYTHTCRYMVALENRGTPN